MLLFIFIMGCSENYGKIKTQSESDAKATEKELIDNWSDYDIRFKQQRKFSFDLHFHERKTGKERRKSSTCKQNDESSNQMDYKSLNKLCWSESFAKITKRERARADRVGVPFSVVDFKIEDSKQNADYARHLLTLLSKSVRVTDEFGWINQEHIGVLLFNAGTDGARKFVEKLRPNFHLIYYLLTLPSALIRLIQIIQKVKTETKLKIHKLNTQIQINNSLNTLRSFSK